jgi:hypothetical protein
MPANAANPGKPSSWTGYWLSRLQRELDLRNYSPQTARNYSSCLAGFLEQSPGDPRKRGLYPLALYQGKNPMLLSLPGRYFFENARADFHRLLMRGKKLF